jgi:hypothetical protein
VKNEKNKRPAEGSFVSAPSFLYFLLLLFLDLSLDFLSGGSEKKIGVRGSSLFVGQAKMKKINRLAEGTIVSASFSSIYCCFSSCF